MKLNRQLVVFTSTVAAVMCWAAAVDAGNPGIYTLDADFAQGTRVNVNFTDVSNQLQLDSQATPFSFIWVAASGRGTVVKIDTATGKILGEYWSAPEGRGRNPSRTTVDGNGNVWTANRDEAEGNMGSVVKIGLAENGQCVDRNGNGVIDTSTGLGDIRGWRDITDGAGGEDGIVADAEDECIIVFQRLPGAPNARHVSVDTNNDVWVGGYPYSPTTFWKLQGTTGKLLASFTPGCGGYGGLIDRNGVLWSAGLSQGNLLRYDLATNTQTCLPVGYSYGLGLDAAGNVWNALWSMNTVDKIAPDGTVLVTASTGGTLSRGVVVTKADNNVWIANSGTNSVTRLDNDGILKASITVGGQPTGVAVDAAGKVWVTNYDSNNVMRIDPATNAVDLTVDLGPGATPYNYSDMTGSTLIAPPNQGTWTIVHDSGIAGAVWGTVTWNALTTGDGVLKVTAASSTDGITFGPTVDVANGTELSVADGRYLKVSVSFTRATTGESPVLYGLTILANRPPDCSGALPSSAMIWPPNHQFVPISVTGVTDPDGDPVTIAITAIKQDEPVETVGDGKFTPDGKGVGTATASVRAERSGSPKVPGNGRVYHVFFSASDPWGYQCAGKVVVAVPHDNARVPVDDGPVYDSTAP